MFRFARALLPVVLFLGLAGCSGGGSVEPTTIQLMVTEEAPEEPVREDVPLGSLLTLQVTSEVDGLLHVHGYEKELDLTAGETTEATFEANIAGIVEVETHDPAAVWIELVVS